MLDILLANFNERRRDLILANKSKLYVKNTFLGRSFKKWADLNQLSINKGQIVVEGTEKPVSTLPGQNKKSISSITKSFVKDFVEEMNLNYSPFSNNPVKFVEGQTIEKIQLAKDHEQKNFIVGDMYKRK